MRTPIMMSIMNAEIIQASPGGNSTNQVRNHLPRYESKGLELSFRSRLSLSTPRASCDE